MNTYYMPKILPGIGVKEVSKIEFTSWKIYKQISKRSDSDKCYAGTYYIKPMSLERDTQNF